MNKELDITNDDDVKYILHTLLELEHKRDTIGLNDEEMALLKKLIKYKKQIINKLK